MEKEQAQNEKMIKEVVENLLEKMGFAAEITFEKEGEGEKADSICNIRTEESSFLIGQYGTNLQALQHIARVLVRKLTDEKVNFTLDVNEYKKNKNISIIALARNSAEQALQEKRAVILRPMSPYERRLVHMELSKNPEVVTESIGENEDRKIVIKPAETV